MTDNLYNYLKIIGSSTVVYLFIIAGIRLFGKKEPAQLSVIDLVFILLISNSVQNAMVGDDSTLLGGLAAAATLFIVNYLLKLIIYRFREISKIIQGEPLMLIYKGKINKQNMDRAKLTPRELMETIREHGVSTLKQVDLAVLEIDGNISILSDEFKNKSAKRRGAPKTKNQVDD